MSLRDDLVTGAKGASAYTGLPERTIYALVEAGRLPAIRLGGGKRLYFKKSELDAAFRSAAA